MLINKFKGFTEKSDRKYTHRTVPYFQPKPVRFAASPPIFEPRGRAGVTPTDGGRSPPLADGVAPLPSLLQFGSSLLPTAVFFFFVVALFSGRSVDLPRGVRRGRGAGGVRVAQVSPVDARGWIRRVRVVGGAADAAVPASHHAGPAPPPRGPRRLRSWY